MADEKHRAKESPMKWITGWIVATALVCVAGSIYYAIGEYNARSREQVDAINGQTALMKSEAARKYYEEKLAAYGKVIESASKIAAMKSAGANAAQLQDQVTQFRTLAGGAVLVIGGRDANAAVALFNRALDTDADAGQFQQLALGLARVCANDARAVAPQVSQSDPAPAYGTSDEILAKMKEITSGPESRRAAAQWLAMLDAGQYGESWKAASSGFQSATTQDQWERKIAGLRKALGVVASRKLKSEDDTKAAPGSPEGERIVLQYDTSFAEKNDSVEIVTTMCDKDGAWRAAAYSVR